MVSSYRFGNRVSNLIRLSIRSFKGIKEIIVNINAPQKVPVFSGDLSNENPIMRVMKINIRLTNIDTKVKMPKFKLFTGYE